MEMRRHSMAGFKTMDTTQSLEMRVALSTELQKAEKAWRDRLLLVLDKGAN